MVDLGCASHFRINIIILYVGIILFQSAIAHKRNGERATAILI